MLILPATYIGNNFFVLFSLLHCWPCGAFSRIFLWPLCDWLSVWPIISLPCSKQSGCHRPGYPGKTFSTELQWFWHIKNQSLWKVWPPHHTGLYNLEGNIILFFVKLNLQQAVDDGTILREEVFNQIMYVDQLVKSLNFWNNDKGRNYSYEDVCARSGNGFCYDNNVLNLGRWDIDIYRRRTGSTFGLPDSIRIPRTSTRPLHVTCV